jgi:hypothetical protein
MKMRGEPGGSGGANVVRAQRLMEEGPFVEDFNRTHFADLGLWAITRPVWFTDRARDVRKNLKNLVDEIGGIDVRTNTHDGHWHPHERMAVPMPIFKKEDQGNIYTGRAWHARNMLVRTAVVLGSLFAVEQPVDIIPRPLIGASEFVAETAFNPLPVNDVHFGGGSDSANNIVLDNAGDDEVSTASDDIPVANPPTPDVVEQPAAGSQTEATTTTTVAPAAENQPAPTIEYNGEVYRCPGLQDTVVQEGDAVGHTIEKASPAIVIDDASEAQWAINNADFFFPNGYKSAAGSHNQTRVGCEPQQP